MDRFEVEQGKILEGKEAEGAMKADFDFDPKVAVGVFAAVLLVAIAGVVLLT